MVITDRTDRVDAIARQVRGGLDTDWIDHFDEVTEDGDKLRQRTTVHPTHGEVTVMTNLTHRYRPGPRRSDNFDVLRIEAEAAADGEAIANPAIPTTDAIAEEMAARLAEEGLDPAWEAIVDE